MKLRNPKIVLTGAVLSLGGALSAQTLYWDTNGATPGAGNPADGDWDASTSNWSTDSTGSIATGLFSEGSDVIFSAGSDAATGNINLSGTQRPGSMTFKNGALVLSGSDIDDFSGGYVNITVESGASATINNSMPTNSNLDVDGTLFVNAIRGGSNMEKTGTGTVTVNRLDGFLTVNGGTFIYTGTGGAKLKTTTINDTGTLRLTGAGLENGRSLTVNSGGTFEIAAGVSQTMSSLSGTGTIIGETGSILRPNGTSTFNGAIEGELTFISGGTTTKTFGDASSMEFTIGANGVNNAIIGDGVNDTTTNLNGEFVFDLSGADLSDGNSWLIVDVDALNESFGGTFNIASFTNNAGLWTYDSDSNLTFSQTSGILGYSIPEPGTYALLFGLAVMGLVYRRRR